MRFILATLVLGGCDLLPEWPDDRGDTADQVFVAGDTADPHTEPGSCGDFRLSPLEWRLEPLGPDVYSIATVLQVDGQSEDCIVFDGAHEQNGLELFWKAEASHWIQRDWDGHDHSGFGPRSCDGNSCEIGDIFETDWVYPDYPDQDELQHLVETLGPPDTACARVANAELTVREYCESLDRSP